MTSGCGPVNANAAFRAWPHACTSGEHTPGAESGHTTGEDVMSETTVAPLQTIWGCRWSRPGYRIAGVDDRFQP